MPTRVDAEERAAALLNEEEALDALDEVFRDRAALPAAGRSYPSMILYRRDPRRYKIALRATDKGLQAAMGAALHASEAARR